MSNQKPPIHQLANFKIDEVSLVDQGANKQRFIVIKRRTDMPDDTQQQETAADAAEPQSKTPSAEDVDGNGGRAESDPSTRQGPDAKSSQATPDLAALPDTLALLRELVSTLKAKGNEVAADLPADNVSTSSEAAVSKIEKRLERLEKHFCLPNSMTNDEPCSISDGHVWPFDLNANRAKA